MLAYLALEGGFHTREALAFMLWPDASVQAGRENLRRMLFLLKDALKPDAIESSRDVLRLRAEAGLWTDVGAFTSVLDGEQRALAMGAVIDSERIAHAVALYRGEFLQGLELDDAPDFGNWVQMRREQYHQRYLQALGMLVESHEREGNLQAGIECAEQWVTVAPLDDTAWHQMLRLLVKAGQLDRARREFQRYRHLLDMELGTTPDASVAALLEAPGTGREAGARRQASMGERRQLTVLSCEFEVTGEPEDIVEVQRQLMACCEPTLRAAGAHVVRIPSGLLAYFGYPFAQEDSARRAVTAALVCHNSIWSRHWGDEESSLPVRVALGVHTGIAISSAENDVPDAGGMVSRLALQLGAMAGGAGVAVSDVTLHLLGDEYGIEPAGQLTDWSRGVEVQVFLVSGKHSPERQDAARAFCGRDEEMARLVDAYHRGGCYVGLVRGEAGLGKSFLVEHFCDTLQVERVVLQCSSELRQMPYHPFVRWMRACERLAAEPSSLPESAQRILETIGQRMMVGAQAGTPGPGMPGAVDEIGALCHELLRVMVPEGGVICFDDVHWADPSTRDVLALLVEHPLPDRMLLITARPEFVPPWKHTVAVDHLDLGPMDDFAVVDLVHAVADGEDIDAELLRDIIKRSEGIPLYAEELTRDVLADRRDPSAPWSLPASLQDLLMARIDSVGRARPVAQFASVVGGEFTLDLLADATGEPRAELAEALAIMLRQNIIVRCDEKAYAFRHTLLREAAYQSQTRVARVQAHARLARRLESSLAEGNPEVLAWHYSGAGSRAPAVKYLLEAARKAAAQCAYREAVSYYRSALEWFERQGEGIDAIMEELRIRMEFGIQLCALYGFGSEQAVETFRSALTLAQPLGDDPRLFPIYWGLWTSASSWANFSMTLTLAETLLRMAGTAGDPNLLSHAYYARGYSHFFLGRFAEAVADLEHGAKAYQPQHANLALGEDARVTNLAVLSIACWHTGRVEDALQASRESVAHARRIGHRYSLLYALVSATELHRLNREVDEVATLSSEALQIAREMGTPLWAVCAETSEAWVKAVRGDATALAEMASCVQRIPAIMKGIAPLLVARWTDACDLVEDVGAGLDATTHGLREVTQTQARYLQSEFERIKGKQLFRQGQPASVFRPWLERALETACALDSPLLALRALTNLVRYACPVPDAGHLALMARMMARVQGGDGLWEVRAARGLLSRYGAQMVLR
ncbi:AAA family ATPase [Pigmentiphaga daeguensis]|uniref:AAA family ATPase n=1 Tax=Pigmentiphaga daeguensis TaxID=414049 RepID=UPI0031DF2DA4